MMREFILLLSFISFSIFSWAVKIEGTIYDEKGNTIPYASITVQNTNKGTTSDAEGYFYLHLDTGNYVLKASYMGYASQTKELLVKSSNQKIDFQLKPHSIELSGVDIKVKYEDPAIEIMRLAIERKKQRIQDIRSFSSDVYLKGSMRFLKSPKTFLGTNIEEDYDALGLDKDGKGIVYGLEQKSYYMKDRKQELHKIEYVRQSGDPQGLGFSQLPPILDVYENRIDVLGVNPRGFISPLHNQAFLYYDFEYLGEIMDGDQKILKIKLNPKRAKEAVFKGNIYIIDSTYDVHSVELIIDKSAEINIADKLIIDQMFRYISNQRVIQKQNIYVELELLGFVVGGDFLTAYSNQKVNEAIDWEKENVKKNIVAQYNKDYQSLQKEEEWEELRPVRMSEKEKEFFKKQDSILVEEKKKEIEKVETQSRIGIANIIVGGELYKNNKFSFHMSSPLKELNFNTVEGVNLALDLKGNWQLDSLNELQVGLHQRYGFVNGHYNPNLYVDYKQKSNKNSAAYTAINLRGGKKVFAINQNGFLPEIFNTFSSLVQGVNPLKLQEKYYGGLEALYRSGTGWVFSAGMQYNKYIELYNRTDYAFNASLSANYTENKPKELNADFIESAAIIHAKLQYQPGWKYISFEDYVRPISSNYPVFSLAINKAIPKLFGADADYTQIAFSIDQSTSLKAFGALHYYGEISSFLGNNSIVPWAEWKHYRSNSYILHSPSYKGFFMKPYYLMSNTAEWSSQLHAEWQWKGFITNKIPGFKYLQWTGVVGGHALLLPDNKYYSEFTFGLENIGFKIYRFLRADGVVSWQTGFKPMYGFRLGINLGALPVGVDF